MLRTGRVSTRTPLGTVTARPAGAAPVRPACIEAGTNAPHHPYAGCTWRESKAPVPSAAEVRGCSPTAGVTGLEPAASAVTGLRSNHLSYTSVGGVIFGCEGTEPGAGIEPATFCLQGSRSAELSYPGEGYEIWNEIGWFPEPGAGIEPAAFRLRDGRSSQLSYRGRGADAGSRTRYLRTTRAAHFHMCFNGWGWCRFRWGALRPWQGRAALDPSGDGGIDERDDDRGCRRGRDRRGQVGTHRGERYARPGVPVNGFSPRRSRP